MSYFQFLISHLHKSCEFHRSPRFNARFNENMMNLSIFFGDQHPSRTLCEMVKKKPINYLLFYTGRILLFLLYLSYSFLLDQHQIPTIEEIYLPSPHRQSCCAQVAAQLARAQRFLCFFPLGTTKKYHECSLGRTVT